MNRYLQEGDLIERYLSNIEQQNQILMNLLETIIEKFDGVIIEDNQWTMEGSNGKRYIVEWDKYNKKYSCQCKGYIYRKKCRHITELSESFRKRLAS